MKEKLRSAIYGFAVGDALGVPYEFKARDNFRCVGMIGGGSHCQPVGTWSDDTSMILATMKSLAKNNGKIDPEDMMNNFIFWAKLGEFTPWGNCFDIGNATARALRKAEHSKDWTTWGNTEEFSNGNGSLMRILPFAFLPYNEQEIDMASALTHNTSRCKFACETYVKICQDIINDKFNELDPRYEIIRSIKRSDIRSTGYVIDSLIAALWSFLTSDSYDECVLAAVNLGDDTDTIGALAGGLAGLHWGFDNIPSDWVKKLAAKDQIDQIVNEFAKIISA